MSIFVHFYFYASFEQSSYRSSNFMMNGPKETNQSDLEKSLVPLTYIKIKWVFVLSCKATILEILVFHWTATICELKLNEVLFHCYITTSLSMASLQSMRDRLRRPWQSAVTLLPPLAVRKPSVRWRAFQSSSPKTVLQCLPTWVFLPVLRQIKSMAWKSSRGKRWKS